MKIKLSQLNEHYRRQAQTIIENRNPLSSSKPKQRGSTALGQASKVKRIDTPVHLVFHIYRTGTRWDVDNAIPKSLIDGLVHSGIIEDDSIQYVKGIISYGHTVKSRKDERVEISIYEAD